MNSLNSRSWNRLFTVATRVFLAAGAACLMLLIPAAARADSTQTYNVTATLSNGQTVTGTVTIDFTTGNVTTGPGGITVGADTFTCPGSGGCVLTGSAGQEGFGLYTSSTNYLVIVWNDLSGNPPPSSISIVDTSSYCVNCQGSDGHVYFTSATMTAVNAPEPPEALLLLAGLGALGAFVVVRRKPALNSPSV